VLPDLQSGAAVTRLETLCRELGQLIDDLLPVLIIALAVVFAPALPWLIGSIANG